LGSKGKKKNNEADLLDGDFLGGNAANENNKTQPVETKKKGGAFGFIKKKPSNEPAPVIVKNNGGLMDMDFDWTSNANEQQTDVVNNDNLLGDNDLLGDKSSEINQPIAFQQQQRQPQQVQNMNN